MQSIFKKTLIAASIAAVGAANAATIVGNGGVDSAFTGEEWPLVSAEGFAIAGSIDIGTGASDVSVDITTSVAIFDNDTLRFTFSGATISQDGTPALAGFPGLTFTNLNAEAGTITFRNGSGAAIAPGASALSGVTLSGASGAVTVSMVAVNSGDSSDTYNVVSATPIAAFASEFTLRAGDDALNAVIDVEEERKQFTSGGMGYTTTVDGFSLDIVDGADLLGVTAGTATISVTGANLDFLNDGDGDLDSGSYALVGGTENATETTFEANTLTVTSSSSYASTGDDDIGINLIADGVADADAQVLEDQSFTSDLSLNYSFGGTAGSVSQTGIAVGSWTLSGASFNVPYMPFVQGVISPIINLSNDGTVAGDIEVTAFNADGETFGPVIIDQTASAGSVTSLWSSISLALTSEGMTLDERLDITIVVNSPAADIELTAAYKDERDGGRVNVNVTKSN